MLAGASIETDVLLKLLMKLTRIASCLAALLVLGGCGPGRTPSAPDAVSACVRCHTFNDSGATLSGPNLHGIVGEKAGTRPGFAYSNAMRDSGVVWTPEALDAFLQSPARFMPGNRMAYFGEVDAARRVLIIEYMQDKNGDIPHF